VASDSAAGEPAAPGGPREGPTGRGALDRDRILRRGLTILDEQGMRALTMRKLGTDLGVDPMALYHHVPGREGLLDGITDLVLDDLRTTPGIEIPSTVGWSDYLHRLGHGMRAIAQRHPRIFPLVATRPPEAPWLRPPMRSLWLVESFLSTLVDRGFTEQGAIAAYRVFSSFLLGHLLLEATARGAESAAPIEEPHPQSAGHVDPALYPTLASMREGLQVDHGERDFADALEQIIGQIEALRAHGDR